MSSRPARKRGASPSSAIPRLRFIIPGVVAVAFLMEQLDQTIIVTAVPQMAESLATSALALNLAVTTYILALAIFIPVSGWFADRFGARRVFVAALLIFTLGSVLCGMAVNFEMLIATRALQGFGGAMMTPVGRLILIRSFPRSQLVTAMTYMTLPAILGPVIGPLLGGVITTYLSWRWIFYVNIPFGIIGIVMALRYVEDSVADQSAKFDFPGFLMVGIGFITRNQPDSGFEFITYRDQVGLSSTLLLYVALTAPDLICPDRRQRVLALMLARPLTSIDYVLVKVATVITCVFAFSLIPQIVLFLGQTGINSRPRHYVAQNAEVLWQAPLSCALLALFYGCVGIAFATLTSRRVIATASIIGSALVSAAVASGIVASQGDGQGHAAALISLVDLPLHLNDLVFLGALGPDDLLQGTAHGVLLAIVGYVVTISVAVVVLLRSYRPSRAGSHL